MKILDSLIDGALKLTSSRDRDAYLAALVVYLATGEEPELSGNALAAWTLTFPVIMNSRAKSMNARKPSSKTESKTESKTVSKTVSKSSNKPSSKTESKTVAEYIPHSLIPNSHIPQEGVQWEEPPTLEDVRAYFQANCLRGDPDFFWATYDAKGWVDGNGFPVTRWTSQALKWSRMQVERDADKPAPPPKPVNAEPETTLEEDIEAFKAKYGYDPCV